MTAEQQAAWPPPVGARVSIKVACCGRTTEVRVTWPGDEQPVTVPGCPNSICFPHEPHITATWSES